MTAAVVGIIVAGAGCQSETHDGCQWDVNHRTCAPAPAPYDSPYGPGYGYGNPGSFTPYTGGAG